jgi:hypothetical protein
MNPALAITVAVLALCAPAHAMDAASRANVADMMAFAAYNDVCEPPDRLLPTPGVGEALVMGRVILRLTEAEQQVLRAVLAPHDRCTHHGRVRPRSAATLTSSL